MSFQNDINIIRELEELKAQQLIDSYTIHQSNNDSIQKLEENAQYFIDTFLSKNK